MMWRKTPITTALTDIAYRLDTTLENHERVLWLVSGGSNVANQVKVLQALKADLSRLVVLPADERFGAYDHPDSNASQLRHAGFNHPIIDVLAENDGFAETVGRFTLRLREETAKADCVFATLGMGVDGHILGALPHSLPVASVDMAAGFTGPDFQRVSATTKYLHYCDEIAVLTYGHAKAPALKQLKAHTETIADLPATALYACGNVTIYNDQLGD